MEVANAEVTINLADEPEVSKLIKAVVAFDNAVAEFGLEDFSAVTDSYQRVHDALNALAVASAARAVMRSSKS